LNKTAAIFMVEVFKTNILKVSQAKKLVTLLQQHFPGDKINFDKHDCDKILRIEGQDFTASKVIMLVAENGFTCSVLE
jgi:hypothetical protein